MAWPSPAFARQVGITRTYQACFRIAWQNKGPGNEPGHVFPSLGPAGVRDKSNFLPCYLLLNQLLDL